MDASRPRGRAAVGGLLVLAIVALVVFGCGDSGPVGTIHGKVTYKGSPVPENAVINLISDSGYAASADIQADGTYEASRVPVGKYRVLVRPPEQEVTPADEETSMLSDRPPPEADPYPNIPEKYRRASTSGEALDVKEGDNTFDLDMQ